MSVIIRIDDFYNVNVEEDLKGKYGNLKQLHYFVNKSSSSKGGHIDLTIVPVWNSYDDLQTAKENKLREERQKNRLSDM